MTGPHSRLRGRRRRRAGDGRSPGAVGRFALVAVLGLGACRAGDEAPGGVPQEELPAGAEMAPPPGPARYVGHVVLDGAAGFVPCGTNAPIAVDGPALQDLLDLHATLTPGEEPFEGLFVDLLAEPRTDGGGEWLDALEIHRASWEGWGCGRDEESVLLEASGSEPDWTLTVEEGSMTWRTPEAVERFVHAGPYPLPRGGWSVEGTEPGAPRAEFLPGACSNPMTGAYTALTVSVTLEGRELRGCGFLGPGVAGQG